MKAVDIVKPEPRDNLEAWERWANRIQSELLTMPYTNRKKIEVRQDDGYKRLSMPTDSELLATPTLEDDEPFEEDFVR